MARITKAQLLVEAEEKLELAQDEVAALKDELARRERAHQDEIDELITRSVAQVGDYEEAIRRYQDGLDKVQDLAIEGIEEINDRVLEARAKATFLAQGIVTALSYGGDDIEYLQDFLGVLVAEWIPVEEVFEEEEIED